MKDVNGVRVISEHCDKCRCNTCRQWDYAIKTKEHIRCPFEANPCILCQKKEYVAECVFMC